MTIPHRWQRRFNRSSVEPVERFADPIPERVLSQIRANFVDFRRAYEADGMTIGEFDSYGATVRTLRGFIGSYQTLVATVRGIMLPNPDTT